MTFSIKEFQRQFNAELIERGKQCQLLLEPDNEHYRAMDLVSRHQSVESEFCRACVRMGYLSAEEMERAARRYRLGVNRYGAVIFWQVGLQGQVYDGKIMYYRADCHRDKQRKTTWVRAVMKGFYQCPVNLPSVHGLFGCHLLGHTDSTDELTVARKHLTVAVVESEKTAVIMSERYPNYLWLAAGGLNELTPEKLFVLRGCRVIIFPDTDPDGKAYDLWYGIARKTERLLGQNIYVSPLLEQRASSEQKQRKIDIADYYFESKNEKIKA